MIIDTRQNSKGRWWCNGTIQGSDVSFEGITADAARIMMRQYLSDKKINPEVVKWTAPVTYNVQMKSQIIVPHVRQRRVRIDQNPFG